MSERAELVASYLDAVGKTTKAWGGLGKLFLDSFMDEALLRKARRVQHKAEFHGFKPTETQNTIIRRTDPVAEAFTRESVEPVTAHPTGSVTVNYVRIEVGLEHLHRSKAESWKQAKRLTAKTVELLSLAPNVLLFVVSGLAQEDDSQ